MAKTQGRVGLIAAGLGWGAALGIALGALVLAPAMPGKVDLGFSQYKADAPAKPAVDNSELEAAQARAEEANDLLAQESGSIVSGALKDVPVTIVRTAAADSEDVESVRWLLNAAGASDSGELTLTERFSDQAGADELSSIVANTLPSGAKLSVEDRSPGLHAGQSLATVLFDDGTSGESKTLPDDRTLVLDSLQQAGFVEFSGSIVPAGAVVIVDGPARSSDFSAQVIGDFAKALGAEGKTALATQGAEPDAISGVKTVGGVDAEAGRIKSVLAVSSGGGEA
ncbi:copper transporter [Corynebacterium genitalium]|nr:copper transporter [Corynebacterium genitalium]